MKVAVLKVCLFEVWAGKNGQSERLTCTLYTPASIFRTREYPRYYYLLLSVGHIA